MRRSVKRFAEAMEAKLKEHDEDRGTNGWVDHSPISFISRIYDEVEELKGPLYDGDYERAKEEAADVANFAMMIFDICDKLLD